MYRAVSVPDRSLQGLWRYLSHTRLVELLTQAELFFCHLPRLSDGFEGTLTERTRARLYQVQLELYHDAALAAGAVTDYENHRDAFFVNCWHINDCESYLMWRAYGERGFAIRTNFERLGAAFDRFSGSIEGRMVQYIDFSREAFDIGNVFTAVTHKDLPYRDEREFRLTFWKPDLGNAAVPVTPSGVRVPIDLDMLVEAIYVSPRLAAVPDDVRRLVEQKRLSCQLVVSAVQEKCG